jgi:hypothetical protein
LTELLAALRPDSVDFAVFVHVFGAMVLVGGLVTATGTALVGWRDETPRLLRFSYLTLLSVALPGYLVMRGAAEWVYEKEHWDDLDKQGISPTWLDIGFVTADIGGLLFLIALVVGAIGYRRRNVALLKAATAIAVVLVAAYVVAAWAMAGKPG